MHKLATCWAGSAVLQLLLLLSAAAGEQVASLPITFARVTLHLPCLEPLFTVRGA
jgi:hypothetical protein